MDTTDRTACTRRRLLRTGAGVAAAGVVGAGTAGAQAEPYGGYLADVDNFEGTADATGLDTLSLSVGAGPEGLLFGPTAAVLVEPGTTVVWEWTGNGQHNVVHETDGEGDPVFDSGELVGTEGTTFEHTFETEGQYRYYCLPHKQLGMKGAIAVGEDNVDGDLTDFGVGSFDVTPVWGGAAAFGFTSLLGIAAYRNLVDDD